MIQRIQTLWLLLAASCAFLLADAPLFEANLANNITTTVIATDNLLLFVLIIAAALLALGSIFLFKKRPLQFKLCILNLFLAVAVLAMVVWKVNDYRSTVTIAKGSYQWGGLLPVAMIVFLLLAARGMYKDEKLVKSLDRLR
jgi:hypothetical protein